MNLTFNKYLSEVFGQLNELPKTTPYYDLIYDGVLQEDITVFLEYFKKSKMFYIDKKIECTIIPNMDINAITFKVDGNERVGLCYGLIALIYHYYGVMFCSDNFLPHIKSTSSISNNEEILSLHTITTKEIEENFNSMQLLRRQFTINNHKIPKDSLRFEHMIDYGLYTCLFVFLHEIGHIVRGHMDNNENSIGMVQILHNNPQKRIKDIESIYLELDADKFASFMYSKFFLERHEYFKVPLKTHFSQKWLSILLYFVLVDIRMDDKSYLSHPKPAYRYALIKRWMTKLFHNKIELPTFLLAIDETEKHVFNFFNNYNINNLNFFDDLAHTNDIFKLMENYENAVEMINNQYKYRKELYNL